MRIANLFFIALLLLVLSACTEANIEKADSPSPSGSSAVAAAANDGSDSANEASPSPSASPKNEKFKVGDSVKFDDLVVTVNSVRNSKSQIFKPDEGNVIILVNVTVENKGKDDENISSLLQTEVSDNDGYKYNLTIVDDAKGSLDGTVAAGGKLRGEIAFEVPKAAKLEFTFSDPFKKGQAVWQLN